MHAHMYISRNIGAEHLASLTRSDFGAKAADYDGRGQRTGSVHRAVEFATSESSSRSSIS